MLRHRHPTHRGDSARLPLNFMRRVAALALSIGLLVAACGDDASPERGDSGRGSDVGSVTTGGSDTTESTSLPPRVTQPPKRVTQKAACEGSARSSPATFAADAGVYAAHIVEFVASDVPMTFDVIQWLVGEEARRAYQEDTGESDGPPNDYWVRNVSDKTRSANLAGDATLWMVKLSVDGDADVDRATSEELSGYLEERPATGIFWLTFDRGAVTEICEQYVP